MRHLQSLALAGLIAIGAPAAALAQPGPWDPSLLSYAKPQILAPLPDGRKIHLFCLGTGSPTVLLLAGLGAGAEGWRNIHGTIAAKTRACAWDRAGYGFSSPSPHPQDTAHTTADLEAALKSARLAGPYVVVGASLGGFETIRFTDRNRQDVVGIVLSDASIPNQFERMQSSAPAYALWSLEGGREANAMRLRCADIVKANPAGNADVERCLDWRPGTPEDFKHGLRPYRFDTARLMTQHSLNETFPVSAKQVLNPSRNYGQMPMIVLTAGAPTFPGLPAAAAAELVGWQAEWDRGHLEYAALSSRGTRRIVQGAPHAISMVKPQAVIDAVNEVVDAARAR